MTTQGIITILLNVVESRGIEKFMIENDIHPYGSNYGYQWVSYSGKFGNAVLSTDQLYSLYQQNKK